MELKQFRRKDSAFNFVTSGNFLQQHPTVYIYFGKHHFQVLDSPWIRNPQNVVCCWLDGVLVLDFRSEFIESTWSNLLYFTI